MPRPCAVEFHVVSYCSDEREAPRDKRVAARNRAALCSGDREAPRDKPVASREVWLRLILKDHKRRASIKSRSAADGSNLKIPEKMRCTEETTCDDEFSYCHC